MQRYESPIVVLAVLLAAFAGFVDALAFTNLGGFFASFMSGNSTRLGVGLGSSALGDALTALSLIFSFVAGVILAAVIVRARPGGHMPWVMLAVTALIAVGAALGSLSPGAVALMPLAAAMGAENGIFQRDGEAPVGITYMTGSLVRMGQKLAGALMGDADRWGWTPYFALWAGFVGGVVIGVGAQRAMGWTSLWLAVVIAGALTLIIAGMTRRGLRTRAA